MAEQYLRCYQHGWNEHVGYEMRNPMLESFAPFTCQNGFWVEGLMITLHYRIFQW